MEGCDLCAEAEVVRADTGWTWTNSHPFFVKEESEDLVWIVPANHYDDASTDSFITGTAVTKAVAEAAERSWTYYDIAVARADLGEAITHLAVMVSERTG